jgi:hypothetical protein
MPASKYKFLEQTSYDHEIGNADDGKTVGTLRVKPSTILWKPKGAKGKNPWFSVDLDALTEWIKEKNYKVNR